MQKGKSRAYKLQLSEEGIQLFLRCHCRLGRLVGDLLPYGMTLLVAVSLLHEQDAEVQALEIIDHNIGRNAGKIIRYVGTSSVLSGLITKVSENVCGTDKLHSPPPVWKMFLAALVHMECAGDDDLFMVLAKLSA